MAGDLRKYLRCKEKDTVDLYICVSYDSVWWSEAKQMDRRASIRLIPFDSKWNIVAVLFHKDCWVLYIYICYLEK